MATPGWLRHVTIDRLVVLAGRDCGRVIACSACCPIVIVHLEQQHVPIAGVAERTLQLLTCTYVTCRFQLADKGAQVLVPGRRWRLAVSEKSRGSLAR